MDEEPECMTPGFSRLLAEVHNVVDDVCMSGASSFVAGVTSNQHTSAVDTHSNNVLLNPGQLMLQQSLRGPQTANLQLPSAGLQGSTFAQDSDFPRSVTSDWLAQATENPHALLRPSPPVFNAGAAAPQPYGGPGASSSAANGSRRGRPAKPRLAELQHELDKLTEQFTHLSKENGFLRSKLKALERVVPYRDANVGWLAAVQAMQSAPEASCSASDQSAAQAAASAWELHSQHQQRQQHQQQLTEAAAYSGARAATLAPAMAAPSAAASGAAALPASASWGNGLHAAAAGALPARTATAAAPGTLLGESLSTSLVDSSPAALVDGDFARPSNPSSQTDAPSAYLLGHGVLPAGIFFSSLAGSSFDSREPRAVAPAVQWNAVAGTSAGALHVPAASHSGRWAQPSHLPGTPAVVRLCPGPDGDIAVIGPAEVEELRRCTGREFGLLWKHIVLQMGVLVMAAETFGPASAQYARLERFIHRSFQFMDRVSLLSPTSFFECMNVNLETWERERPSDEFWAALGDTMKLSEQQLSEVESLARVFERNVTPVIQERVRLASELSAKIAASEQAKTSGEAIQVLDAVDHLAKQLERNVLKEHQTHWDIGDFLCYSVLDPLQLGRVLTAGYPYVPDGVAIMHASKARKRKVTQTRGSPAD